MLRITKVPTSSEVPGAQDELGENQVVKKGTHSTEKITQFLKR